MRAISSHHQTPDWQWQEMVWTDPLSQDLASDLLEQLATSPELGQVCFELRTTKAGAKWLIGAGPQAAQRLRPMLTGSLPVRVVKSRLRRMPVAVAGKVRMDQRSGAYLDVRKTPALIRALLGSLSQANTADTGGVVVQVLLGSRLSTAHFVGEVPPTWWELIAKTPRPASSRVSKRAAAHGFACQIRIGAAEDTRESRQKIEAIFGGMRVLETPGVRFQLQRENPSHLDQAVRPWKWPLRLTSLELPGLIGLPVGEAPLPLLDSLHPRLLAPTRPLVKTERVIGSVAAPGVTGEVGIPIRDAAYHSHLLGPTGQGKSTVMLNLVAADIAAGRGVLVLDPKGDLATDVLSLIPRNRLSDVVVIDPTNPSPVGFNPLEGPAHLSDITADSLLATLESIFHASWGVRTADVFTASLLTLSKIPGANLLWLPPLLTDPAFRKKVLKGIDDPIGVGAFWRQYDAKPVSAQATEIAPVLNKLRQLILRPNLRAVLGQSNSAFAISDLFTKRRIVIVNLNRGILGADASRLLGSVLIGQLWSETLARQRIPQTRRHIVGVFIDEAHDFLSAISGDLSDALAQARSLGVAFTLANQYLGQLSPEMKKSIETNARSKVIFGLAGSDATATAKHADGLDAQDFLTLPKYQAYVNVVQDAQNTGWISVATKPAPPSISNPESVYAASHEHYGVPAAHTDQAIIDLINPPIPEDEEPQVPVGRVKR